MRYSAIKQIIAAHIAEGDTRTVHHIASEPGLGKSAMGDEIGTELNFDNVFTQNLSMLEIPDAAGLYFPDKDTGALKFYPSPVLSRLQTGRNLLILDEFADSSIQMQNVGRRISWAREINGVKLSPETYIIMMSNRSVDKSGAGKLSGKVKNAVTQYTMEANLDDWVEWALTKGNIDPVEIQFLRFKPNLLSAYNPDVDCSPTPRQWELVNRVPKSLPTDLFFAGVAGKVGEGPAAEYAAFRKIYEALVSFEDVVMNPKTVPVPKDLSAQFAIVGSLSHQVTPQTIERVVEYVDRMTPDFGVMFWQDAIKKTPAIKTTKSFIKWATSAGNVILN